MMPLHLSPEAEEDLVQAAEYLDQATGSEEFGDRLHDELDRVLDLIAENPWMGRAREELVQGLRSFPCRSYTIFWRLYNEEIEVVRVLHQRQDVEREFGA